MLMLLLLQLILLIQIMPERLEVRKLLGLVGVIRGIKRGRVLKLLEWIKLIWRIERINWWEVLLLVLVLRVLALVLWILILLLKVL